MILTRKQEEGLRIAVQGYHTGLPYVCISGYAGSGKSTLVKFIVAALNLDPEEDVCYVAFTGKAATVLQQKGCPNAMTAHKLLYWASPKPDGKYIYKPRPTLEKPYKVLIVDEVSMLPKPMWERLLAHRTFIIALGDPGQLPPIIPEDDNHVLDKPHVFLDEIMRQAQDSEIIRLSMHIRENKPLSSFEAAGAQVQVLPPNSLSIGMCNWADQILCATNEKRNFLNNLVRESKGYGPEPVEGDKVISLSNHWDFLSAKDGWALTNGSIGTLGYNYHQKVYPPRFVHQGAIDIMYANVEFEEDTFNMVPIDYKFLKTGEPALTPREAYILSKAKHCDFSCPYDFTYAYAITTHKFQGSQAPKILVIEERFPFDREEHKRWLYTAATRAEQKLVVVRKD
jgi:exodeoxyribonuclease-5